MTPGAEYSSLEGSIVSKMLPRADYPITADEMHCRLAFCVTVETLERDSRPAFPLQTEYGTSLTRRALHNTYWTDDCQWPLLRRLWVITVLAMDLQRRSGEPHPFHRPAIPCPTADRFEIRK